MRASFAGAFGRVFQQRLLVRFISPSGASSRSATGRLPLGRSAWLRATPHPCRRRQRGVVRLWGRRRPSHQGHVLASGSSRPWRLGRRCDARQGDARGAAPHVWGAAFPLGRGAGLGIPLPSHGVRGRHLWGLLGAFWGLLGVSWGFLGGCWGPLGASWGFVGAEGSNFRFAVPLLGPFWSRLGALLGCLGRLLGRFEALLGRLGTLLGASWAVLGRSWGPRGSPWSVGSSKKR